jgi:HPt (histidine-containing phosphotransfer) domain-containing protein
MNLKKLAENLGIEENEFSELMAIFLEKSSSDLSKMQSAIDEGDTDKAMTAAHSIKGTAATLGLKEICEVAKRMETNAYQNNLDGVAEGVRTIKEKMDVIAQIFTAKG